MPCFPCLECYLVSNVPLEAWGTYIFLIGEYRALCVQAPDELFKSMDHLSNASLDKKKKNNIQKYDIFYKAYTVDKRCN